MFTYDGDHDFSGFLFYDTENKYVVNDNGEIVSSDSANFCLESGTFVRRINLDEGEIGETQAEKNKKRMVYIEKKDIEVSNPELVEASIGNISLLYNRDTLLIADSNDENKNYVGSYYVEFVVDSSNNTTKLIVNLNSKEITEQTGSTYYGVDVLENTPEETTEEITRETSNPKVNFNLKDGDNINSNIIYAYRSKNIIEKELENKTTLLAIHLTSNVTEIGDYVFYSCTKLIQVAISNSVTIIGNRAFEGCAALKEVTISDSVTSIGDYTFKHCTSLTQITIPSSVTTIGDYVFQYCKNDTKIIILGTPTIIRENAFTTNLPLSSLTIIIYCNEETEKKIINKNNITFVRLEELN